jgi:hypothetical protein
MKHLFGFIWVFLGTICNRRSIYVIIIQNSSDKRPLERPCLSLGLSDANYFSIWRLFVMEPTLQFYMCCLFFILLILGKSVFKIR